jgi:hypothetical protein
VAGAGVLNAPTTGSQSARQSRQGNEEPTALVEVKLERAVGKLDRIDSFVL